MSTELYRSLFREYFGPTAPLADCGEDPYIQYIAEHSPGGGGFVVNALRDPRLLSAVLFALLLYSPLPWQALVFVFLALIAGNMKPPAFTGLRVPLFVYLRRRLLGEPRTHLGLREALDRPGSLAFEDWRRVPLPEARGPAIVLAETIAAVRRGMRWRMFAGALLYVGVEFGAAAAIAVSEDRPIFLLAIPGTIACGALVLHPAFRYLAFPVLERFKLFVDPLLERSGQDRSGSFASRVTPLDMQGTMFFPTIALFVSVFVPFALPAL